MTYDSAIAMIIIFGDIYDDNFISKINLVV